MATFFFDASGRWSGGGNAFLSNAALAAERYRFLRAAPEIGIPIIARNVPHARLKEHRRYVLAPQNALAWHPRFSGWREGGRVLQLRLASDHFARRALGLIRISSAIPRPRSTIPLSPIFHNVLDRAFDDALDESERLDARIDDSPFVSIGSIYTYRNFTNLVRGYALYRLEGGHKRLLLIGDGPDPRQVQSLRRMVDNTPGASLRVQHLPRHECLHILKHSAAVICPSAVEASPLSALEAAAMTPNLVLSDIVGHTELLAKYGPVPRESLFDPVDPESIAAALHRATQGHGSGWHSALSSISVRTHVREAWVDELASWLADLAEAM